AGVEGAAEADGEGAAAVGALHRHGRAPARAEVGRGGVGGGVPPGPGERRDRGLQRVVRGAEGHALRRDRRSGGGEEGEVGEEAGAAHGRRGGAAETNEGRRGAPPLPSGAGEIRKGRGSRLPPPPVLSIPHSLRLLHSPRSAMQLLDWLIVLVYMGASLALGVWLARRASGSMEDFFVSGRQLTWWLAGTSMAATT